MLRSASSASPAGVSRYFCLLLRGLAGMVISIKPLTSNGFRTWCLNLVRSHRPATAMSSTNVLSNWHFRIISTWCRLSANLVPAWALACGAPPNMAFTKSEAMSTSLSNSGWEKGSGTFNTAAAIRTGANGWASGNSSTARLRPQELGGRRQNSGVFARCAKEWLHGAAVRAGKSLRRGTKLCQRLRHPRRLQKYPPVHCLGSAPGYSTGAAAPNPSSIARSSL